MKEFQEIVNAKVSQMVSENTIQEAIESGVQNAITKAISSQFESYGSITRQIEEAIKDGLQINVKDLPFETYNGQMLVAVKQKLGDMFKGLAVERFMDEIDKVLAPAPSEMTINEFVEVIAGFWKTDEPWDANDLDNYATVEIKEGTYPSSGVSLSMWKQKESSSTYSSRTNSADLQLYLIDGKIRISHRQSYNPTCFSEHEAFVFKLYAAGTTITGIDSFDPDDCELELKDRDY